MQDNATETKPRNNDFYTLVKNIPQGGDIIRTIDNEPVRVYTDINPSGKEVMFCYSKVDDDATGWYLHNDQMGLKVMIAPKSQDILYDKAMQSGTKEISVLALRVIRQSRERNSVVAEVIGE